MKISSRKTVNYALLILLTIITLSCSSTRSLLVQIPEPTEKELPANIQSLTIVTQAVNSKFNDLSADSLQRIFYKSNFDLDTVIYDRQAADTTIKALGELLFESGRYDFVIPEDRFLRPPGGTSFSVEMPWSQVKNLCQIYQTDAVLSLDYFATRVSTDLSRESYFNPNDNNLYSGAGAQMSVNYEALFRVYDPAEEKVLVREFLRDTLIWEDTDGSLKDLFSRFTPVKQALTEAGISAAIDFSDKIAIVWHTQRRSYFSKGNDKFEEANVLVDSGNWQSAVSLWKEVAENSSSKSLKSKAQLNVALGYEMLGDVEQAISWAVKSYETMYHPLTYEYLKVLKNRKDEQQKLIK